MSANDQFNDSTNNDVGAVDISIKDNVALLLTGSLNMTVAVNDVSGFNDIVYLRANDATRRTDVALRDPLYYIRAPFDINGNLTLNASGTGNQNDDSWSMSAISVTKAGLAASGASSLYYLPTGSKSIKAATAQLRRNNAGANDHLGTRELTLSLSVDNVGDMTASAEFVGADFQSSITENLLLAQRAFWDVDTATGISNRLGTGLDAQSIDVLSATLTNDELDIHFNDEIAAEVSRWDGKNTINDWTIAFTAVGNDVDTNLSLFARKQGANDANVFDTNDQIVTSVGADYQVTVQDLDDNEQVVVGVQKVYGVLYQS